MNVNALIDAVVRQTTVLIAHLATAAGVRAPLANVADQVFVDLSNELRSQGVGGKVIADMFGMALRTWQAKMRRLSESATERGHTLWEAVLAYVTAHGQVRRGEVLYRFRYDDEATVRGVLNDLVESGLVFKAGRGDRTTYRAASTTGPADAADDEALVWVAVHRHQPATQAEVAVVVPLDDDALCKALAALEADGRIARVPEAEPPAWRSDVCLVPFGAEVGVGAALFDHYQAAVSTLCARLRADTEARPDNTAGGSTYGFEIWDGHPHAEEVLGLLAEMRARVGALRARVDAHNAAHPGVTDRRRVVFYLGQTVLDEPPDHET